MHLWRDLIYRFIIMQIEIFQKENEIVINSDRAEKMFKELLLIEKNTDKEIDSLIGILDSNQGFLREVLGSAFQWDKDKNIRIISDMSKFRLLQPYQRYWLINILKKINSIQEEIHIKFSKVDKNINNKSQSTNKHTICRKIQEILKAKKVIYYERKDIETRIIGNKDINIHFPAKSAISQKSLDTQLKHIDQLSLLLTLKKLGKPMIFDTKKITKKTPFLYAVPIFDDKNEVQAMINLYGDKEMILRTTDIELELSQLKKFLIKKEESNKIPNTSFDTRIIYDHIIEPLKQQVFFLVANDGTSKETIFETAHANKDILKQIIYLFYTSGTVKNILKRETETLPPENKELITCKRALKILEFEDLNIESAIEIYLRENKNSEETMEIQNAKEAGIFFEKIIQLIPQIVPEYTESLLKLFSINEFEQILNKSGKKDKFIQVIDPRSQKIQRVNHYTMSVKAYLNNEIQNILQLTKSVQTKFREEVNCAQKILLLIRGQDSTNNKDPDINRIHTEYMKLAGVYSEKLNEIFTNIQSRDNDTVNLKTTIRFACMLIKEILYELLLEDMDYLFQSADFLRAESWHGPRWGDIVIRIIMTMFGKGYFKNLLFHIDTTAAHWETDIFRLLLFALQDETTLTFFNTPAFEVSLLNLNENKNTDILSLERKQRTIERIDSINTFYIIYDNINEIYNNEILLYFFKMATLESKKRVNKVQKKFEDCSEKTIQEIEKNTEIKIQLVHKKDLKKLAEYLADRHGRKLYKDKSTSHSNKIDELVIQILNAQQLIYSDTAVFNCTDFKVDRWEDVKDKYKEEFFQAKEAASKERLKPLNELALAFEKMNSEKSNIEGVSSAINTFKNKLKDSDITAIETEWNYEETSRKEIFEMAQRKFMDDLKVSTNDLLKIDRAIYTPEKKVSFYTLLGITKFWEQN